MKESVARLSKSSGSIRKNCRTRDKGESKVEVEVEVEAEVEVEIIHYYTVYTFKPLSHYL